MTKAAEFPKGIRPLHLFVCYDEQNMEEPTSFKKFWLTIKKHWLTVWFILGFATDVVLLNQIDNIVDNLILLTYALLATFSLLLFYVGVAQKVPAFMGKRFIRYMPNVMQYSFGGLLSGMLIFYGRSGDWITSAPFLFLILAVIFGNEIVQKRSDRLLYHLALYFIGVFSYIVLVLPVILGSMGDLMFVLSGIVALIFVTIVIQLLYRIVPNFMRANTKGVILSVGSMYILLNSFYFLGIIPPIPLSLTKLEIAHSVVRLENSYRIVVETQSSWRQLPYTTSIINPTQGQVACFARVYAPVRLQAEIFHRWEKQMPDGKWQQHAVIGYPISGSNSAGYGGFTFIESFFPGMWRCSVETKRGQVLGQRTFRIESGRPGTLVTRVE